MVDVWHVKFDHRDLNTDFWFLSVVMLIFIFDSFVLFRSKNISNCEEFFVILFSNIILILTIIIFLIKISLELKLKKCVKSSYYALLYICNLKKDVFDTYFCHIIKKRKLIVQYKWKNILDHYYLLIRFFCMIKILFIKGKVYSKINTTKSILFWIISIQ